MNTIWLKLAAVAVVLVVVLVVGSKFMSNDSTPAPAPSETEQSKTFYDMAERDKQLMEEPKPVEPEPQPEPPVEQAEQPAPSQPSPPTPVVTQAPTPPTSNVVLPSSITRATTMYFKPMSEIEDIEAQRLLPVVTAGRSIGRLPVTHFKLMVDGCRQILQKWPDSWYAFRAKQMLEDMPERYWRNYKVTEEELDIRKFLKQRRGTQPRIVEPIR
ncbi:MAG: hypothetical protein JSW27_22770 [Phycisphaerales bacterium]|nr:MAG: hypothetical protein JSW27_22770 [Phycisphaerales bacterium]